MVDVQNILSGVLGFGGVVVVLILFVGLCVVGWFFFRNWLKYQQFNVIIFKIDALGNRDAFTDQGGIFLKSGQKRFWLKKCKSDITPDTIKYVKINGKNTVILWQFSDNDFRVVDFSASNPTIGISATVGEEDVNWALNAYERGKKMFAWQGMLKEYMPWIALFFVGIIFVIIFIQFFKKLDLLPQMVNVMKENVNTLKEVTQMLKEIKSGTTVIGG